MGTPDATGSGRPLHTAGLVLLGVAAVALLLGLFSIATGDGSDQSATGSRRPATSTLPGSSPTSPTGPASPTAAPPSTGAPVAPPPITPPPITTPDAGPGTGDATRGAVRVYNNSTLRGLAVRAAEDIRAAGWPVREVGNYSGGTIPTTTVYYGDESQRSAADALGERFGMRTEPRFDGIRGATPGLIVIVTNDYSP